MTSLMVKASEMERMVRAHCYLCYIKIKDFFINMRKRKEMKRIVLTLAILFCMMIVGCSETSKVETPPWSDSQIEQMENDVIESVPFSIVRF